MIIEEIRAKSRKAHGVPEYNTLTNKLTIDGATDGLTLEAAARVTDHGKMGKQKAGNKAKSKSTVPAKRTRPVSPAVSDNITGVEEDQLENGIEISSRTGISSLNTLTEPVAAPRLPTISSLGLDDDSEDSDDQKRNNAEHTEFRFELVVDGRLKKGAIPYCTSYDKARETILEFMCVKRKRWSTTLIGFRWNGQPKSKAPHSLETRSEWKGLLADVLNDVRSRAEDKRKTKTILPVEFVNVTEVSVRSKAIFVKPISG